MGRNLTNLYISESFQYLVQISGSAFETGIGVAIPSVNITASNAVSSSYAVTASYALNASTVDTGSLMKTGSVNSNVLTFTKGDGSTFNLTVATGSAVTVNTGSLLTTASAAANVITFTKGDGSTFPVTVATGSAVSASYATTASLALNNVLTASSTNDTITYTKGDGTTFTNVINNVSASISSSYALTASFALNAPTINTGSFATTGSNTFIGNQTITGSVNITGSLVMVNGADIVTHHVKAPAVNGVEIQNNAAGVVALFGAGGGLGTTFYGQINGTVFSGSSVTASLLGTASYATQALSASYAPSSNPFPYTGSAQITGSFAVTGSVGGNVIGNNTDTYTSSPVVQQIVTLTQAEYNSISGSADVNTLYIISGSTPVNFSAFATTGSNIFNGNQTITGSVSATLGFTGSLLGTASYATSALSSSYATQALSASYVNLGAVTQNAVFSGSIRAKVNALTISSATASLDCSIGNFFTLQLVSGSNTFINPSNILPGQTINLKVATTGSGTVSFATTVKQVSGSSYVPTTTTSNDIVTFIAFDSSNLYLANVKNLI